MRERYEQPLDWSVNDMYVEEMKHFLQFVAGRSRGMLKDGRQALDLALCARRICR